MKPHEKIYGESRKSIRRKQRQQFGADCGVSKLEQLVENWLLLYYKQEQGV